MTRQPSLLLLGQAPPPLFFLPCSCLYPFPSHASGRSCSRSTLSSLFIYHPCRNPSPWSRQVAKSLREPRIQRKLPCRAACALLLLLLLLAIQLRPQLVSPDPEPVPLPERDPVLLPSLRPPRLPPPPGPLPGVCEREDQRAEEGEVEHPAENAGEKTVVVLGALAVQGWSSGSTAATTAAVTRGRGDGVEQSAEGGLAQGGEDRDRVVRGGRERGEVRLDLGVCRGGGPGSEVSKDSSLLHPLDQLDVPICSAYCARSCAPSSAMRLTLTSLFAAPLPHVVCHPFAHAKIVPSDELPSLIRVGAVSHRSYTEPL